MDRLIYKECLASLMTDMTVAKLNIAPKPGPQGLAFLLLGIIGLMGDARVAGRE